MIKVKLKKHIKKYLKEKALRVTDMTVGIYFLKYRGCIVYVGQSKNISNRIYSHLTEKTKVFDDFDFIECSESLLLSSEASYIVMHDPVFNGTNALTEKCDLMEYCLSNNVDYEDFSPSAYFNGELFKSYEVAERFGIPKPTAANWAKAKGTWREKLYKQLEQVMVKELAEKAKEL